MPFPAYATETARRASALDRAAELTLAELAHVDARARAYAAASAIAPVDARLAECAARYAALAGALDGRLRTYRAAARALRAPRAGVVASAIPTTNGDGANEGEEP